MLIRATFWIIVTALCGCASPGLRPDEGERLSFDTLVMNRSACLGRCPVYSVEVTSKGNVTFRGERFVALPGTHTGFARNTDVSRLDRALADENFFSLNQPDLDACTVSVTDNPTVEIVVVNGRSNHRVSYYYGCETPAGAGLDRLSKVVDEVAGTRRWVRSGAL